MLTNTEKKFSILFFIIVLFEIITGSTESLERVHYIAKPAIVLSLIFLFVKTSKLLAKSVKRLALFALSFSLLGDILLMFTESSEHFFTFGLVAFLIAHTFYILLFLKHRNKTRNAYIFTLILSLYATLLGYYIQDGLGPMLVPVIIYVLIILTMATTAYLRKGHANDLSYILVFIGAIFFMISDSILALNKFYQPIPLSNISIMVTYAIAQYLIVIGILKLKTK